MRHCGWWAIGVLLLSISSGVGAEGEGRRGLGSKSNREIGDKSSGSVLDSVKGFFGVGSGKDGKKVASGTVPSKIAVMPAGGDGDEEERGDITDAIHNHLGTSQFRLLKQQQIQDRLKVLEMRTNAAVDRSNRKEVAKSLRADGLLLVNVDSIDEVFVATYAHYKIAVTCELYSLKEDAIIWDYSADAIERGGGLSLNPIGIIANVATSAELLTPTGRQQVMDQLAREIAKAIPQPKGNRVVLPRIEIATSNAHTGPFKAGDEFKVSMVAESGLDAQFSITGRDPVALQEDESGQYAGDYLVRRGDDLEESIVEIRVVRPEDGSERNWRLPGRIGIDTAKPAALGELSTRADREGLWLSWRSVEDDGTAIQYNLERANTQTGGVEALARVAINTYLDRDAEPGVTYIYRVTPVDAAGNEGGHGTANTSMVAPGPTLLSDTALSTGRWSAVGSPYLLSGRVTLRPGSELTVEAGTLVELAPGTVFDVGGRLYIEGSEPSPVLFYGDGYEIRVGGFDSSDRGWRHLKLEGSEATLRLERAALHVVNSSWHRLNVILGSGSRLEMSRSMIANSDIAVSIDGGQLVLDNSEITQSRVAVDVARVSRRPAVHGVAGRLSNNGIHIRTSVPLKVAGVALQEDSLDAAAARLEGPVTIDWRSLGEAGNLERARLAQDWRSVVPPLQRQEWKKAIAALDSMKGDAVAEDLLTVLEWITGKKRPRRDTSVSEFLVPVREELLKGTSVKVWLQEVRIPRNNKLLGSDVVILKQARKSFSGAYLQEHFQHKRRTGEYVRAARFHLHEAIINSRVGYRSKQGLTDSVWICHVINRKLLEHKLAMAGLVDRAKPDFVLAVAIDGDDSHALRNRLFRMLDQQNITFMDLSDLRSRQRVETARAQRADLLLTGRIAYVESNSSLADSLKVIDVDISIKLEGLRRGNIIRNYHHSARTTAFKKRQGLNKAVTQGLQSIRKELFTDLFSHTG